MSRTSSTETAQVTIPGPVLSRLYQEMSNGMLGFNQALHIALIPFPFPFAQLIALLVSLLVVAIPFFVTAFAPGYALAPAMSSRL